MKQTIIGVIFLVLFFESGLSQTINFNLTSTTPQFQDADVGDMEFGDIDNDGDPDLIITGKGGPVLTTLYINDGNGNFTEIVEDVIEDVYRSKIGLNDIDKDGDLDLLISGANSSPVLSTNLYLNDGSGNFSLVSNTPFEPIENGDFAFGDIDNDGDDDIIMIGTNAMTQAITKLYKNDGAGVFSEVAATNFEPIFYGAVVFFDCDNDNDLDVLVSGTDENENYFTGLYVNDGSGTFNLVPNTAFNDYSGGDIAIGDSDNDGDLDVLLCGNVTNSDIKTELYLNDGLGTFTLLPNTVFSDVSFGEASFNDFDNDGDLDVFVLGTGEGGLATNSIVGNVYENQGANNFIHADSLIGGYFSSHAVADIDGDDDLDLILGGTTIGSPIRATWMYTNESVLSGVEEVLGSYDVNLFPNPVSTLLNVRLIGGSEVLVNIYSQVGQLVYSRKVVGDFNQIELNLSDGIYIVKVQCTDGFITKKLIVQNNI